MGTGEHLLELGIGHPFFQLIVQVMHFGKSRLIFRLASQLYKDPDIFNLTVELSQEARVFSMTVRSLRTFCAASLSSQKPGAAILDSSS